MITITWNQSLSVYDVKLERLTREDFDKAIVCIKLVPLTARSYDKDTKIWHITEPFKNVLEITLKTSSLTFVTSPKPPQSTQNGYGHGGHGYGQKLNEVDQYILTFFKSLSYEVAAKAFKLNMAAIHPDRGGSQEQAAKFSEAWTFLEKTLFLK